MGALDRAVGDEDAPDPVLVEVTRGELDGFTGADEQGGLVAQVAEDLPRQADCREGHGDRAVADGGIRAYLFCHREGVLKQPAEQLARGSAVIGDLKGRLDLAEYLGLAEYHGIESAGHSQQVRDRLVVQPRVEVGLEVRRVQSMESPQPVANRLSPIGMYGAVDLGAVAGGQDESLADRRELGEAAQGTHQDVRSEGDAFAYLHGGGLVVESDYQNRHL